MKEALDNAIERQLPDTKNLMFHSDQGCQYLSEEFRAHLFERKITQSMSRRGNYLDNAVMERFFRSLKTERLNFLSFINHQSVVYEVENYLLLSTVICCKKQKGTSKLLMPLDL